MNEPSVNLELLSLKDASELTPYSADYLNLLARKGKIKARKIGRDWLITKSDLFAYVRRQHLESQSRLKQLSKYLNLPARTYRRSVRAG
jgi:excisionase family DNA binding protein